MKLKLRLTMITITMMVVVVSAITIILISRAAALEIAAAETNLENMTGLQALELDTRYQVYLNVAQTMSQIMSAYEAMDPAVRRSRYTEMLVAVLESRPNFVGIYTVWKPGVIDNKAGELANTPGTDASGNFIALITRKSGRPEIRAYADWQNALATVKNIPTLGDPVRQTVNGKDVLVSNITVPIISGGTSEIIGLIGINFELSATQAMVQALRPFGNGRAILISNNGTVAAHYDPAKVGQSADQVILPVVGEVGVTEVKEALRTGTPQIFSSNDRICDAYPFYVGETTTPWILLSSVEQSTVLASVYSLTQFTVIILLVSLVTAAAIIFLIASSIAGPIAEVSLTLKDISEGEGDLTKSIAVRSKDEVGDLARYFNQTLEKIRNLVVIIKRQAVALLDIGSELASNMAETASAINEITANIQGVKGQVINQSASVSETNATMEQITANIDKLSGHIDRQSSSVAQSSSAIEEMLTSIQSVAQTLVKNTANVKNLAEASEVGRTGLQEVAADIQEIARESEGLLEINAVMENIASQTNLL
ncbi:MAG: methyl-accepting chemotaxis protein, partial [Treponema sp.]|nr:methyl-accepting chemotaxis protein [Treponema sp.]